jgi:hypothetical protein
VGPGSDAVTSVPRGLALALALFVASAATVDKYLGTRLMLMYLIVLAALVPPLLPRAAASLPHVLSQRAALVLVAATLVVLLVAFVVVYPHANTHDPGAGSDRDDAADLGARALLHGHFPYRERTYLGNPISQFPGALVLAAPFVLAGHSAYAAFFWLPLLLLLLRRLAGEWWTPLLLTWAALLLSPTFVREIVTGGDLVANCVSVMLGAGLVLLGLACDRRWAAALAALFLGLALSSRLNFLFVLPPLLVAVWRRSGARAAVAAAGLVAAAFAAVTLPFYLGHESRFTPIGASDKLVGFNGEIPGGARTVIAAGLCLSVVLALRAASSTESIFGQTALVQAFFVVAVVVLASAKAHALDLGPLVPGYGLPVLLFALGALPLAAVGWPRRSAT